MSKNPTWKDYGEILKNAPLEYQTLVFGLYDDLYASRVIARDVLGNKASEEAILRVFESLQSRRDRTDDDV